MNYQWIQYTNLINMIFRYELTWTYYHKPIEITLKKYLWCRVSFNFKKNVIKLNFRLKQAKVHGHLLVLINHYWYIHTLINNK